MKLESKTVRLRFVEESDAGFILSLRLDDRYNQFLSKVTPDLEAQKSWIRSYKIDEQEGKQFYFIIERVDGKPCGTVRVYDLREDSFCWGSWILNEDKTRYSAIESTFLVYEFGFKNLGFKKSHFDVMKANKSVLKYHRRMGAIETGEDEQNIYFTITDECVKKVKSQLEEKLR
jgi:RimJ/RimL family protein N-acetyltransferase